jgi:exopolysaccharide biosynthesis polyprenyl glycosylphosphotransferase
VFSSRHVTVRRALIVGDVAVFAMAWILASLSRHGDLSMRRWQELIPDFTLVLAGAAGLFLAAMGAAGLHRLRARWSTLSELVDVAHVVGFLSLVTLAALFAFRLEDVSRLFLLFFFAYLLVGAIGLRVGARRVLSRHERRGRGARHLLIVGSGEEARVFARQVLDRVGLGVRIVGFVNNAADAPDGYDWLGKLNDLPQVLSTEVIHEVAICVPLTEMALIDSVADVCRELGKDVRIPVQLAGRTLAQGRLETVDGLAVVSVAHSPSDAGAILLKRVLDLVLAVVLVVVLSPLLVGAVLAILLKDGRPILFKQLRGGYHGEPFNVLKFRTMVVGADAQQAALREHNERTGPVFKMGDDPRVTRVGRFLRRTSIDELPQLFNVIRGEMSLVGPRPAILEEIEQYDLWHRRRLSVKPGITGLWQVTARTNPDFEHWVELDLQYIDTWSLWGDLKLIAKTPAAVMRQTGE